MKERPPRLIEDPELRPLLEAEAQRTFSAERLAYNKLALTKAIAGGAAAGSVLLGMKSVALILALAAGGTWLALRDREAPLPPPPAPAPILVEAAEPPAPEIVPPVRRKRPAPRVEKRAPPPSELELHLARLRGAQAAFARGAHDEALRLLDGFPEGAVSLDAALLEVDVLAAMESPAASDAIDRILPRVFGPKKAALLRLQGDLRLKRGDCPGAKTSYRRTLALDPSGREAEAARRGLDQCLDR
jgi:hypothetical protein